MINYDLIGLREINVYEDFAISFIEKNEECIKYFGTAMGLSEIAIIATAMAIAEEYSTRKGLKFIIDEWQDYKCKRGWKLWFLRILSKQT